ncbi:MAG: hypothetical protein AVDCRST_MAG89-105 [uncultured Gemmatimonadetes bacterium]|uniref:Uncharacterized protein n=1 Tax=uncultured Gemmatimonadota bacterium TaxID=203437 RepID=A0A6J4K4K9_9BACT|nr:MAG: hypothetical protein AVDCRST_MAG89-105 [uncultured Gemmatimonadota bacterium]
MTRSSCFLLLFLAACATQSPGDRAPERVSTVALTTGNNAVIEASVRSRPEPRTALVLLPLESAWAALPGVYAAMGLTGGGVMDEAARQFGMPPTTLPRRLNDTPLSRFVDCGSTRLIPNADTYAVRLQVSTQLVAEGTALTRVQTLVEGTARPREMSGNPVLCTSTGELERRIVRQLQRAPA